MNSDFFPNRPVITAHQIRQANPKIALADDRFTIVTAQCVMQGEAVKMRFSIREVYGRGVYVKCPVCAGTARQLFEEPGCYTLMCIDCKSREAYQQEDKLKWPQP